MRLLTLTFILCNLSSIWGAEWPEWRGPGGQGISTAKNLPVKWTDSENVAWKTAIPGRGWSSPVIDGKQIWVTTAHETVASPEAAKERLKKNTGDQPLTLLDKVDLHAVCVDRETGAILHDILLITEKEPQWVHKLNSYASPTPFIDDGFLYCHFGTFGTACVDMRAGKLVWTNTDLHVMHENGPGGSAIVWKDLVIFHLDGSDIQYIAALNKKTGQLAWKTMRSGEMRTNPQLKKSYGTPVVTQLNGQDVLISPASDWLYGYEPASGRELWKMSYGMLGFSITPRPVLGHGMLFMSTGFSKPAILGIKLDGSKPEIAWKFPQGAPTMSSPLLVGDELYFSSDNGLFTCLDAKTGKENYRERLGGNVSSSPIVADGKIYLGNRDGLMYVIQPGKEFKLLAKNELPGAIMATPAAVDSALYVRTEKALFRLEQRSK